MGLFGRKMSKAAGEWAAIAMGCMVYADGAAGEKELAAAEGQLETNPVLKHSIGQKKATTLFRETVAAIRQVPAAMLPTYEQKLGDLAKKVKGQDERNFALATVIAVSMGDAALSQKEHAMLERFQKTVGANIPIPAPGQVRPEDYSALENASGGVETGQMEQKPAVATGQTPPCPSCGKGTQWYEGYGAWCGGCQKYAPTTGRFDKAQIDQALAAAEQKKRAQPAAAAQKPAASAQAPPPCPKCGKATRFYQDHGHWCAECKVYAQANR